MQIICMAIMYCMLNPLFFFYESVLLLNIIIPALNAVRDECLAIVSTMSHEPGMEITAIDR